MKVLMIPHLYQQRQFTDGISQVVKHYFEHLPNFGVDLVLPDATSYDIKAVHAGITGGDCTVAHLHGLYWTADYECNLWQYNINKKIVESVRAAKAITVPSPWVAKTIQRDLRMDPFVIPHGINWNEWQGDNIPEGDYVLWNKNRNKDVCDPTPVMELGQRFSKGRFVTTYTPSNAEPLSNVSVIGVIPHDQMKQLVQSCLVYLATTKETFGIGILEAMASGKPVLGFDHGGIQNLVKHGVNGYLAWPGDYGDLANGLVYCIEHRKVLGENGREMAREFTWEAAVEKLVAAYQYSMER